MIEQPENVPARVQSVEPTQGDGSATQCLSCLALTERAERAEAVLNDERVKSSGWEMFFHREELKRKGAEALRDEAREDERVAVSAFELMRTKCREAEAQLATSQARQAALTTALETVYGTFIKDEAQGFRSRDRQFAIEILGAALSPSLVSLQKTKEP